MKYFLTSILFILLSTNIFSFHDDEYNFGLYFKKHPAQNSKAVVLLTHGVLEHSGRYLDFIDVLNKNGISVLRYDLRGHGKSFGERAHIKDFDSYVQDLDRMILKTKSEFPNQPLFLFGHSMGGLITYIYTTRAEKQSIDAVILSSPALSLPMTKADKIKLLGAPIARKIFPKLLAGEEIPTKELSDIDISEKVKSDKLMIKDITISLGHELIKETLRIEKENLVPSGDFPVFVGVGEKDKIVDVQGVKERAKSFEADVVEVLSAKHELLNSSSDLTSYYIDEILRFLHENGKI